MKRFIALLLALAAALAGGARGAVQDLCGPFADVSPALCPFVFELYALGITAGTSPTTFSPDTAATRGEAAVFVAKGLDQALKRSSRDAALGQWWTTTPRWDIGLGTTPVGDFPALPQSDGADIWVPNYLDDTVSRVRASDGKLLEAWTGALAPAAVCVAMGKVFVTGSTIPGKLYMIDPTSAPGNVTIVASTLGEQPSAIAFDGSRLWTANVGGVSVGPPPTPTPSISIVTPGTWSVQTVTEGISVPSGLVFDGTNMWTTDLTAGTLLRLDSSGSVVQTVPVGNGPGHPVFDGTNIWVPNRNSASITVVRSSTGSVVATLTGNGLDAPDAAAFDGRRVLVTSFHPGRLSLWNAQSLEPIANFPADDLGPEGACSDGTDFWVTLAIVDQLARF